MNLILAVDTHGPRTCVNTVVSGILAGHLEMRRGVCRCLGGCGAVAVFYGTFYSAALTAKIQVANCRCGWTVVSWT